MVKNLVIVESPSKAKTIGKFLGPDYTVMSSYGHIRDLRKHKFSIDVDHGFEPEYEIPDDKKALVSDLRKAAKDGNYEEGSFLCGQIAGMVSERQSAREIVDDLVDGAERVLKGACAWVA